MKKLVHQRNPCQSQEAGYALIESLMAIVVVAVLMTAVTPMIVFSAGLRMQAKRIQLATQAAQSYITDVSADGEAIGNDLLIDTTQSPVKNLQQLSDYSAPPDLGVTCNNNDDDSHKCPVSNNEGYFQNRTLYCVNFDEKPGCGADSMVDMIVQPIALYYPKEDESGQPIPDVEQGYNLTLRVYRANSFHPQVFSWYGKLQAQGVDNSVTQGLGDRTLPLFQTATFIAPSDTPDRGLYNAYCERIGGCQP